MSSGSPSRPAGIEASTSAPLDPSHIAADSSVLIRPGQIAFAVTLGARSRASPRISPSMPALAAAYAVLLRAGKAPPCLVCMDEMQTILPQPSASILGATACAQLNEPL